MTALSAFSRQNIGQIHVQQQSLYRHNTRVCNYYHDEACSTWIFYYYDSQYSLRARVRLSRDLHGQDCCILQPADHVVYGSVVSITAS